MNLIVENRPQASMQYWGAFMDEVLNFSINSGSMPSDKTPDNIMYRPLLAMYSKNKAWLKAIKDRVISGGALNLNDFFAGTPGNQHIEWRLGSGDSVKCFRFLRWVKPFLTFKQAQAEIFDEFLLQKREVRRYTQNLVTVPAIYSNPYARMDVEENLRQRLLLAKGKVTPDKSIPQKVRLAGIVDADMSLGLYLSENDHRLEFLARGTMVSVRRGLLEALYKKYGGAKPSKRSDTSITKAEVPTYEWQVNGYNLGRLLTYVEPDLVFKKEQARYVIEFLKVREALMSTRKFIDDPLISAQRAKIMQSFFDGWQDIDSLPADS